MLHEGGHGIFDLNLRTIQDIRDNGRPTGDEYQYLDDKTIITGLESNYINKTNLNSKTTILPNGDKKFQQQQSTRSTHHSGDNDLYQTDGVNSITPKDPSTTVNGTEFIQKNPIHVPLPKNATDHPEDRSNFRNLQPKPGIH